MSWLDIPVNAIVIWWRKSVRAWTVNPKDVSAPDSIKSALTASLVGGLAILAVHYVLLRTENSSLRVTDVWLLSLPLAINAGVLISVLILGLRTLFGPLRQPEVFCVTLFVLAGLLPVLHALSWQQFAVAIDLFRARRDPSNAYLTAAIVQTLDAATASTLWRVLAWLTLGLQVFAIAFYFFWCLPRALLRVLAPRTRPWTRVFTALVFALALYSVVVHFYTGRLYWHFIGLALEGNGQ